MAGLGWLGVRVDPKIARGCRPKVGTRRQSAHADCSRYLTGFGAVSVTCGR